MQCYASDIRTRGPAATQHIGGEVQARCRSRNRSNMLGVDRLVAAAILHPIFPPYVWRKRNVPDALNLGEQIAIFREANHPLTVIATVEHISNQCLRKMEPLPNRHL